MASSQKMAGLVTKMSQMRAVGASEAKWVPTQVSNRPDNNQSISNGTSGIHRKERVPNW